jgi:hypothetical protein
MKHSFLKRKTTSDYEPLCWQTIQPEAPLLRMLYINAFCDKRNVYARVGFDVFYFLNYVSCYHELCELGNLVPWCQEHECVSENEVTVKYSLSLKTNPVLG